MAISVAINVHIAICRSTMTRCTTSSTSREEVSVQEDDSGQVILDGLSEVCAASSA